MEQQQPQQQQQQQQQALQDAEREREFCHAVSTFYGTSDAATRSAAGQWLESFERSDAAWSVATGSLCSTRAGVSVEARLFAAQVLRRKVGRDLFTLSADECFRLRDAVFGVLLARPPPPLTVWPKNIVCQLCCSLAEFAIHCPAWPDPVAAVCRAFCGCDPAVLLSTLHHAASAAASASASLSLPLFHMLIEFSYALPYELYRCKSLFSREDYANRFSDLLTTNADFFLALFVACLSPCITADTTIAIAQDQGQTVTAISTLCGTGPFSFVEAPLRARILECVDCWLAAKGISVESVLVSPLLEIAYAALYDDETFQSAVSIIPLIYEFAGNDSALNTPLGRSLVDRTIPRLNEICASLLPKAKKDENKARGLAHVVSNAFSCLLPHFLETPSLYLDFLAKLLLPISAIPHLSALDPILDFWLYFTEGINEFRTIEPQVVFSPLYHSLLEILLNHLTFPTDFDTLSIKERDELLEFRNNVAEVMSRCLMVLKDSVVLNTLLLKLQTFFIEQTQKNSAAAAKPNDHESGVSALWQPVEGVLFAFCSIASKLQHDCSSPVIRDLMSSLPSVMSTYQNSPHLRAAILDVISAYAPWSAKNPDILPFQMSFISDGFSVQEARCPWAAACALRCLGANCGAALHTYMPSLLPFYVNSLSTLSREEMQTVSEAVANIIYAAPPADVLQLLNMFTEPLISGINKIIIYETNKSNAASASEQCLNKSSGIPSNENTGAANNTSLTNQAQANATQPADASKENPEANEIRRMLSCLVTFFTVLHFSHHKIDAINKAVASNNNSNNSNSNTNSGNSNSSNSSAGKNSKSNSLSPTSSEHRSTSRSRRERRKDNLAPKTLAANTNEAKIHPLIVLLDVAWPTLVQLVRLYPRNEIVAECVCKVLRHVLSEQCTPYFSVPHLQRHIELLISMYDSTLMSCWLWVSSHVIHKFCAFQVAVPFLMGLIQRLCAATMYYVEQFGVHYAYDALDELFRLLGDALHTMPKIMLMWGDLLTPILHLAVASLNLNFPPALKSLLDFLKLLSVYLIVPPYSALPSSQDSVKTLPDGVSRDAITAAFGSVAPTLVCTILYRQVIERAFPRDSGDEVGGIILHLAVAFPAHFGDWIGCALNSFPRFLNTSEAATLVLDFNKCAGDRSVGRMIDLVARLTRLHQRRLGKLSYQPTQTPSGLAMNTQAQQQQQQQVQMQLQLNQWQLQQQQQQQQQQSQQQSQQQQQQQW